MAVCLIITKPTTKMDEYTKKVLRLQGHSEKSIAKMELEERIDAACYRHKAETLEAPYTWSEEEWTEIYKEAGMTDEEIVEYRKEQAKYNGGEEHDFPMMP